MKDIERMSKEEKQNLYKNIDNEINGFYELLKGTCLDMPKERLAKIIKDSYNKANVNATNNNKKTGKACLNINFPVCVCRDSCPCKKKGACYCLKGRQITDSVLQAYFRNLRMYLTNPDKFFNDLDIAIKFNALPLFRFFDSGDIIDKEFFTRSIELVKKNSNVLFLMYTKKYDIVNDYLNGGGVLPNNLVVRFSTWSKEWKVDNPHGLPVAMVDFKTKENNNPIPVNAYYCKCDNLTTCSSCKMCFLRQVKTIAFKEH